MILSLVLPFLSHAPRQAVACAFDVDGTTACGFLVCYALGMLFHSTWVDGSSRAGRVVVLSVGVTWAVCVALRGTPAFVPSWWVHALFSSALWPMAYRMVSHHSGGVLAVWSLQGNVADALGCAYGDAIVRAQWVPHVAYGVVCVASAVALRPRSSVSTDEPLLATSERERLGPLVLSGLVSACCKVMTYSASNWMAVLGMSYWAYVGFGCLGTVCAGAAADVLSSAVAMVLYACCCAVASVVSSSEGWATAAVFGWASAGASTVVSICVCTDLARETKRYGRTTALMDGGATLVAAAVQLVVVANYELVQIVASLTLLTLSTVLAVQLPCHPLPCRDRWPGSCC